VVVAVEAGGLPVREDLLEGDLGADEQGVDCPSQMRFYTHARGDDE
jgi:hypothetical protein